MFVFKKYKNSREKKHDYFVFYKIESSVFLYIKNDLENMSISWRLKSCIFTVKCDIIYDI